MSESVVFVYFPHRAKEKRGGHLNKQSGHYVCCDKLNNRKDRIDMLTFNLTY